MKHIIKVITVIGLLLTYFLRCEFTSGLLRWLRSKSCQMVDKIWKWTLVEQPQRFAINTLTW